VTHLLDVMPDDELEALRIILKARWITDADRA
jgi:hypothetical protein